jgi:catechol 2,3-dioxygenase-like lactoylglutathione lyase family enzyme
MMADGIREGGWPTWLPVGAVRVVRRSGHYEETVAFYRDVLGLAVIDSFHESFGEAGTIFGLPGRVTHLEVVRGAPEQPLPDAFDQLVLYLPDRGALEAAVARLNSSGVRPATGQHVYWTAHGAVTFADPDGRGVILAPWIYGEQPEPA